MSLGSGGCPLVGPPRPDRGKKRGSAYGAVRSSRSETYFSGEDCILLQASEIRPQSCGGEVRPGWTTQSPTRTIPVSTQRT